MKDNEMNDTEGVCARQSGGEIKFKNDIWSLFVIALLDPDESLKLHPIYRWCLHQPTN